jgi:heme oxygenase
MICRLWVCTTETIARLPQCQTLPVIDSGPTCLGVLYVLEGATLGGQILRREIASRLRLDADNGAAFLDVYGALPPAAAGAISLITWAVDR